MPRPMLYPEKTVMGFEPGTMDRLEAVREPWEARADVIRMAIRLELERREHKRRLEAATPKRETPSP